MTFDRKQWKDHTSAADVERFRARLPSLELLRQAAVPAERLMAEDHWRVYQQMLQGAIERMLEHRQRLVARLLSDACNSFEDMARTKRLVAECEATIRAWTTAIDLPKQLLAGAESAARLIEEETTRYAGIADEN